MTEEGRPEKAIKLCD